MNKRGQGLPINTVIIAILVIVVLVIIIVFFLGGFAGLSTKMKSVFFTSTAGTDLTLAVSSCETRCEQAELLPDTLKQTSAFCKAPFHLDTKGKGEADKHLSGDKLGKPVEYFCYSKPLNIKCSFECETKKSNVV